MVADLLLKKNKGVNPFFLLNGIKPLRTTEIIARQLNRMDAMSRIETERSLFMSKSNRRPTGS